MTYLFLMYYILASSIALKIYDSRELLQYPRKCKPARLRSKDPIRYYWKKNMFVIPDGDQGENKSILQSS